MDYQESLPKIEMTHGQTLKAVQLLLKSGHTLEKIAKETNRSLMYITAHSTQEKLTQYLDNIKRKINERNSTKTV